MPDRPHMRKVRAKNTAPEIKLRKALWRWGYRGYRLYRSDLPGKPDIVFGRKKKVIFLHGCFWHSHDCRAGRNKPQSNLEYWGPKLERNKARDQVNIARLRATGWDVIVIWECELKMEEVIKKNIDRFLCV